MCTQRTWANSHSSLYNLLASNNQTPLSIMNIGKSWPIQADSRVDFINNIQSKLQQYICLDFKTVQVKSITMKFKQASNLKTIRELPNLDSQNHTTDQQSIFLNDPNYFNTLDSLFVQNDDSQFSQRPEQVDYLRIAIEQWINQLDIPLLEPRSAWRQLSQNYKKQIEEGIIQYQRKQVKIGRVLNQLSENLKNKAILQSYNNKVIRSMPLSVYRQHLSKLFDCQELKCNRNLVAIDEQNNKNYQKSNRTKQVNTIAPTFKNTQQ